MGRPRRRALSMLGLAGLAALATTPAVVAAESITGQLIRSLNRQLLYLAVPVAILVEVILFYAVWRFRDADEARPTRENRQLEITWTAATGLVLLFVGTASFAVLAHPLVAATPPGHGHGHSHGSAGGGPWPGSAPPDAVEIIAVAEQWDYTFVYPDADVRSEDALVLPVDRPVYLYVTSEDVIHSVHVPALGLKQDAFPGQYNLIRTRVLEPGEYRLYCAEYCGTGHPTMTTTTRAVRPDAYGSWLAERRNTTTTAGADNATAVAP